MSNKHKQTPNDKHGLACSRCGCRDLRVVYTRPRATGVIRRRECRHCGHRMTTWERAMK
jgi:transcriptional regulator NrdR family protein